MTTKSIGSGLGANATGSGTVTATNLSTAVVGLTTLFTSEFIVGGAIGIDNVSYEIASITNDTHLALTINYAGTTGTTKTIQLGARNYKSLAAWSSYVNALTLSAAEVGECYNDSEFTEAASVTFGGWAGGSATNTVTLRTATGQSFRDNANVQTNALRYNQANGVGVQMTSIYTYLFSCTGGFFILDGLQLKGPATNSEFMARLNGASQTLKNLIVQAGPYAGAAIIVCPCSNGTVQNVAVINVANGFGIVDVGTPLKTTYTDVSIVSSNGATKTGFSATAGYAAPLVQNCAVSGFTTDYSGTANASSTNNATDKGAFGGTNFGGSGQVSLVGATEWQSVTNGSEDLRLNTTSAKLKDNGATVGPSTDIAGTSRPQGSAYDIGCWELVVSSAAILPPDLFMQVAA